MDNLKQELSSLKREQEILREAQLTRPAIIQNQPPPQEPNPNWERRFTQFKAKVQN